jgi:hypothetical protein
LIVKQLFSNLRRVGYAGYGFSLLGDPSKS